MSVDENVDGLVYYKERIQWQISHNFSGGGIGMLSPIARSIVGCLEGIYCVDIAQ